MEINAVATSSPETSGSSGPGLSNLAVNFDNFLTILIAQLKNQDPLSPLESNEFTSQLVQFSGVEQQVKQNQNLEQLIALQSTNQSLSSVSFIDKIVEATGDTNTLTNGQAIFSYTLPTEAVSATIRIFDSAGDLVFQQPVDTESGRHDFVWNGDTQQGGTALDGASYTFSISAQDQDDATISAILRVVGRVTSVSIENGDTLLGLGDVDIPLDAVTEIRLPQGQTNTQG
jgi:flagellar basal-body rod modification protein FlgD